MNSRTVRSAWTDFAGLVAVFIWSVSAVGPAAQAAAEATAPRIVSLAPHLTELAFDAGIGDALVGVVEWSDYPAAAASLPRIGDAFRFNLERILRLNATHALAWGGGTPQSAITELEKLGVAVEVIEIGTLDQIGAAIERLGALGGKPRAGSVAAASYRARLATFRARRPNEEPTVRLFYQVSEKPLMTLGGRHVINDVFELCGGVNLFAQMDTEAASVDIEAVLARDPAAIVIGGEDGASHWRSYRDLRPLACNNVLHVDPALLVRPTPRILDGALKLCTWLDNHVRRADDPACGIGPE